VIDKLIIRKPCTPICKRFIYGNSMGGWGKRDRLSSA